MNESLAAWPELISEAAGRFKFCRPLFLSTLLLLFLLTVLSRVAEAQITQVTTEQHAGTHFQVEQLASGLGVPWGLAFISQGSDECELLITERQGRISLLDCNSGERHPVAGAPRVFVSGQGGLLDVAVPADYTDHRWIYFTYSKAVVSDGGDRVGATVLARAQLDRSEGALTLVQWQTLLATRSGSDSGRHFGSRIAFDSQKYVYFGVGDRGDRPNAQDLTNHAGTIIRLHRDGRVPDDNPFVGQRSALPEIWSFGHRNPQGLAFDPDNNRLWQNEHGPRGGDEVNRIEPGRNYGWPVISYGKEYWGPISVGEGTHKVGMEQPVKTYIPSIAPASLLWYSGDAFPQWQGNLFAGALKLQHLNRLILDVEGNVVKEQRLLESLDERIRALAQSPAGWVYLSTDSGKILRIRP
ncbi:MAG: PQQ-dependent sugar dehydrogenase [Motiliproteus sp.]